MTENQTKPILVLAIGLLWAGLSQAQQSANTSGGDATGSGGTVSYSIGQIVYTTNTGSTGSVLQGVQNTFEIFIIGINETGLNISLTAFPNPTLANLTLQINNYTNEILSYQLYDMQGQLLSSQQIIAQLTQIDMSSLPTATYFVDVVDHENKKVQTFKIVKN